VDKRNPENRLQGVATMCSKEQHVQFQPSSNLVFQFSMVFQQTKVHYKEKQNEKASLKLHPKSTLTTKLIFPVVLQHNMNESLQNTK